MVYGELQLGVTDNAQDELCPIYTSIRRGITSQVRTHTGILGAHMYDHHRPDTKFEGETEPLIKMMKVDH